MVYQFIPLFEYGFNMFQPSKIGGLSDFAAIHSIYVHSTLSGPAGSVHADGSSAPFEVRHGGCLRLPQKWGWMDPQSTDIHRIGWWENLQETPIFDGKTHGFL